MTTLAILPIKSFDEAKQRLRDELDPTPRRSLVEAMFSDVLIALRRTKLVDQVLVVSADNVAQRIAGGYDAMVVQDEDLGHNQAAAQGAARALELGVDRVLMVPGDCPLLSPTELDELLGRPVPSPSVLIVPDRHGTGTNALVLSPPDALSARVRPRQPRTPRRARRRRRGPRGDRRGPLAGARHRHARGPGGGRGDARADPGRRRAHARHAAPAPAQPQLVSRP